MSEAQWWVGTRDALVAALSESTVDASRVNFVTEASFAAEDISQWCGIDPLPSGSRLFTLHAPEEAAGTPTWRQYAPGYAPECELVAARVPTLP